MHTPVIVMCVMRVDKQAFLFRKTMNEEESVKHPREWTNVNMGK